MTIEYTLLIIFGIVILVQLFVMYVMYVRIRQLLLECERMASKISMTDNELEELTKNVEDFKRELRIT
jgi:cell division protein FtsL